MEIQINGEAVDFTLEQERTLGEVMQGIESWMQDSRLVLASAALGDRDLLGQPAQAWRDIPVRDIGTLSLVVRLQQEVKIANLRTVIEFLDLLDSALRERAADRLGQLREDYPLLAESLKRQLSGRRKEMEPAEWLDRKITSSTVEELQAWNDEERAAAAGAIRDLKESAAALLFELENPRQALRQVVEAMERTIEELGEVSLLLQTGRDRQAMEAIVRFSDLFESLMRIFSWLEETRRLNLQAEQPDDRTLRVLTGEINGFLRELIQAFQSGDSVLIGDLLEYEVAPRLGSLKQIAESAL